jgi:hypothetical protein
MSPCSPDAPPSQASVPYAVVACRSRPTSFFGPPSLRDSAYNIVLAWPPARDYLVPCAAREQHGGPSVFGRRPTSSGTHHRPGSVSSAVSVAQQLDAGHHIGPSVLL